MLKKLKEDWRIYKILRQTVPEDCKKNLFWEFLLRPADLHQRYQQEIFFQEQLNNLWKN